MTLRAQIQAAVLAARPAEMRIARAGREAEEKARKEAAAQVTRDANEIFSTKDAEPSPGTKTK